MRRFASAAIALALVVAVASGANAQAPAPPSGSELAELSKPPVRTSIASQRFYFVMPDRYRNGDPANDRGGLSGPRAVTGYDPTDPGWFHGGDLRGLTGECTDTRSGLARLRELGFTAIWITPPYAQRTVQASSAAYHGYWGVDFTTVDPHLGTEAEFAAFVDCAHRLGLEVYLDVVVNHTGDVILPTGGAGYSDAPYRDCRGRPFDPARFVNARTFPCLRPERMPRPPLVLAADRNVKRPAWLNDVRRYHNRGDIDFSSCSPRCLEQGDFFGLDDLFTEQPAVRNGLAAIYADWIRRYKLDGFRIDTARHVDRAFFRLWVPRILAAARAAGVPDFEIFGEVFDPNAIELSTYVRERGLPNVLDFAFQDAATGFAGGDASARALGARLNDDDYFARPNGVVHTPPTFLGNHDMGRAALKIKEGTSATGEELLRRVLLGYDVMYLLRGAPVVYYGDEFGILGTGGDKAARQDLFPTRVDEWAREERVGSGPIGSRSSFELASHPIAERLRVLGRLRDGHPALSTGATIVRRAQGSLLAVSRIDADARREYVAIVNAGTAQAPVALPTSTPLARWAPLLGTDERAESAPDGTLSFAVPPLTAVLFRADAA
ncbi:MAG: alpha-amylase family glycosyl hydrolase, partial [Actinomycetota bacterium]|nr:alpha-amylase family glycosyl hydrolase [Actinomycetota bacterium]